MGMFKGVEGAKASFDASYLRSGHYLLRIDRVKADKTRTKDDFLAVEMTVLHTFADSSVHQADASKWHRPGESVSHLMMAKHDSFLGNVKAMVSSLMGCHEAEVSEKDCEEISSPEQPMGGMVIEVTGRDILTRAGKPFTKISYNREFPAADLVDVLDEKTLGTYFPGDTLAEMIEAQNEGS